MNICNDKPSTFSTFKIGNLYRYANNITYVHMYTGDGRGVCLNTGTTGVCMSSDNWKDVTDQYCLQKISKGTKC